uniref:Phosphatidylinositol-4-phosphate 3-kinase catalytic subunit type 2 alpha n=1 Tax=Pelusios castaneus TaxID=367368 RepID=A0A8C8SM83_9SAUR
MAQISSSNGLKQRSSPLLGTARTKDVDKEEALQMEAEALAKMQKERVVTGNKQTFESLSSTQQKAQTHNKEDHDLMVFPEAVAKKRVEDKLNITDIDKLSHAELEKLLLDESFESNKVPALPAPPVLSPSFSSPFYITSTGQRGQWTPGLPGSVTCTLPPVYPSTSYNKPAGVFQNGFHPSISTYQSREPVYLGLPGRSQYISYPLTTTTPFHPRGSLPIYHPTLTPEMAKVFDKIASTSEFLKNGKSSTDLEMTGFQSIVPKLATSENSNDISKFDWLDLDPLSKPKVDNMEILCNAEDDGNMTSSTVAEDPWDAVLLEEKLLVTCHLERKVNGKSISGATVTRSQSLNIRTTQLAKLEGQTHQQNNGTTNLTTEKALLQDTEGQNQELAAFCQAVSKLRTKFPYTNQHTNPGFVLSPVMLQRNISGENGSIKVSIDIEGFQQPVTFTCDVSSPVELIVMQALCWVHDDLNEVDISSYILKVRGQEEVLQNKHCVGSHEYIQNCRKWDTEIKLQLLTRSVVCRDLARTEEDDRTPINLTKHLNQIEKPFRENISRHSVEELLEAYHIQTDMVLKNENQHKAVEHAIKAVRKICNTLDRVETQAITESIKKLRRAVNLPRIKSTEVSLKTGDDTSNSFVGSLQPENPIQVSIDQLTTAVYALLQLHLNSGCSSSNSATKNKRSTKEAWTATEHLQFTIFAAHGIHTGWVSNYEKYYLICSLTHNGKDLFKPVQSKKVGTYKNFFYLIKWDELIIFPIQISQLPLESVLCLTLFGILSQNSGSSPDSNKQRKGPEMLGQVSLPLFDFRRLLTCGTKLLYLWTSAHVTPVSGAAHKRGNLMEKIVLQVDFPSLAFDIVYKIPQAANSLVHHSIEKLEKKLKERLLAILDKDGTLGLSKGDKEFLWEKRHYCHGHTNSLPKILASAPHWDWESLPEIYSLLQQWPALPPLTALELLDSKFADQQVRTTAVNWIEAISDDELTDFLPQFVQALKYETYLDNSLVRFILARALGNIRIAHCIYWLLKDTLHDAKFGVRYERILGAFLSVCGKRLREELEKQTRLVQLLGAVAEKVKQTSGSARQVVLQSGMERVQSFFIKNKCCLPLNPSLVAKELNIKACSFFNSNAVPLKVTLVNADPLGEEINVMFKVGEDLRQDMLALQMIKIMDKIWLQDGLDLRMVIFKCLSTGKDRGMVELVPASDTLRKIQVEYGVTGSFKDKPLAEWLRKYNPTEEEYEKASENFIYSCAGCCVATYVLGICDRHNDNIMLRSTGHMFHIDFGKFLGHAQMIGSFKRYVLHFGMFSHFPHPQATPIATRLFLTNLAESLIYFYCQIYVVRVLREGQVEPTFVFRTFDEFQELHNKLGILFPLWKLPGFPNKMVLGRTHIKDVAAKRKIELNSYIQSLMNSSAEVAECDLVYTFFHPLLRDDKAEGIDGIAGNHCSTPYVGGEVKLSISYRNGTLFIMVMHIKDLVTEDGADPNPYVKTYLLPDINKTSKRKTKITRKTRNPTFNEMLVYSGYSKETLKQRELQLSVLSAESLRENVFLGGVTLSLKDFNLSKETVNWYRLTAVPYL